MLLISRKILFILNIFWWMSPRAGSPIKGTQEHKKERNIDKLKHKAYNKHNVFKKENCLIYEK